MAKLPSVKQGMCPRCGRTVLKSKHLTCSDCLLPVIAAAAGQMAQFIEELLAEKADLTDFRDAVMAAHGKLARD